MYILQSVRNKSRVGEWVVGSFGQRSIHPRPGTFHSDREVDAWNGGLKTHFHYFFTHGIFLSSVFHHLYLTLISCPSTIFRIEAPLARGAVRPCPSLWCCQVSAMDLIEPFGQLAGLDPAHSGCASGPARCVLQSRLGVTHPHRQPYLLEHNRLRMDTECFLKWRRDANRPLASQQHCALCSEY